MTRRERLERKAELRRNWAESRAEKASAEWERGDLREEKSGIPLGQPILIGHHSEGKHRRAIKRAEHAMQRAHEHHKMSGHHEAKANGIEAQLARSIFSDDDNALEALEARIAAHEAERTRNNQINAIIRKAPRALKTTEKVAALVALGLSPTTAEKLFDKDCMGCIGIPAYVNQNLGGRIKADRDRLESVKIRQRNLAAAQESANGVTVKVNRCGEYFVTFAEKPAREILTELKAAGYHWRKGSWIGAKDRLPECVCKLVADNAAPVAAAV